MKKGFSLFLAVACLLFAACTKPDTPVDPPVDPVDPVVPQRSGESGITYQLLVYSFADSDGDGVGDFKGIAGKMDYFKSLGVQALWLSPIHPSTSYHGYDVEDYETVNPLFGSEEDFKSLVSVAHAAGIKIYIDYVLNHTSKVHPWFKAAKADASSKYRNYYNFSDTPKAGYSSTTCGENPGKIKVKFTLECSKAGIPEKLTCEKVDIVQNPGTPGSGKYLWYGNVTESTMPEFYTAGDNIYTLSLEMETEWGVLVRTSKTQWGSSKFGASSEKENTLSWGKSLKLKASSDYDILMPWMKTIYYESVFGPYMPDINYGAAATCENSDSFKDMCKSADKWIALGIDGFRLDAVKHIYPDEKSDENPLFLKKFYDHCNAAFLAAGHSEPIYMVGEQWNEPNLVAPYYKGLNAFFEFAFCWRLLEGISNVTGSGFAEKISGYHSDYSAVRTDAIAATKLSNHDEDRIASQLGRNRDKMKLSAAVLLTSGGEPYIYQGEELGYWGTKSSGDIYVRTPILWNKDISSAAIAGVEGQYDASMLTSDISVEVQSGDANSILNAYRNIGVLRDRYVALAKGSMIPKTLSNTGVSAWYRQYDKQKILVLHNFSPMNQSVELKGDNLAYPTILNGSISAKDNSIITLGPYASVFYLQ